MSVISHDSDTSNGEYVLRSPLRAKSSRGETGSDPHRGNRRIRVATLLVGVAGMAFASSSAHATEPTKKDCVAANESGQDLRQSGKLREARAALSVCMAAQCPRPVREDCAQRLSDIEAALPTLVFVAKDAQGNDVSDARVSMDGARLAGSDGTAVAIDPGEHKFTFEKEGLPAVETAVVVREGDKNRRIQVTLEATSPPATTGGLPAAETPATSQPRSAIIGPKTQRAIGIVVGGAGGAGIVLGAILGLAAKSTYDHAFSAECPGGPNNCTPQGASDGQQAHSEATVSTVAFIAGGALLAGGAAIYFLTPSASVTLSPTLAYHGGGIGVGGRF